MRAVKDVIRTVESKIKTRSRKGYQALTRSFAQLRGRIVTTAKNVTRRSPRSKGGGQR